MPSLRMLVLLVVLGTAAAIAAVATTIEGDDSTVEGDNMLLPPGEFAIDVQAHHGALEELCPRLQSLIAPVLSIKRHEEHEAEMIAHAIEAATMMQDMHSEFKTSHHREWTCDQVAAAVEQKRYRKFRYEVDRWFHAEAFDDHAMDVGGVRHPPDTLADMVDEFQAMAIRVGLVDASDRSQIEPFHDCAEDVRFLVKWYTHVVEARRKLARTLRAEGLERNDLACVTEYDELASAVHAIVEGYETQPHHHLATVPQWHAVHDHVSHLEGICSHIFPPGPPPAAVAGDDARREEDVAEATRRKTAADEPPSSYVHPGEPRRTIPHDHDPSSDDAHHHHDDEDTADM